MVVQKPSRAAILLYVGNLYAEHGERPWKIPNNTMYLFGIGLTDGTHFIIIFDFFFPVRKLIFYQYIQLRYSSRASFRQDVPIYSVHAGARSFI